MSDDVENTEQAQEGEEQQAESTNIVEMDDATQKRFNRIYGNMKQYERMVEQMGRENREYHDRLLAIEKDATSKKTSDAVSKLKEQKIKALDEGDHEKVAEIDDDLATIRSTPAPVEQRQEQVEPQADPQQEAAIRDWGNEMAEDGSFVRPWAQPGHPHNAKAAGIGAAVFEDTEIVAQGTEAVLAEIDRLMGNQAAQPKKRTSPVLSGDSDVSPKSKVSDKLTADETKIAKAMGLAPDAYLKSKQSISKEREANA